MFAIDLNEISSKGKLLHLKANLMGFKIYIYFYA